MCTNREKEYGESGTWTIEKKTGRMCGHVIAGHPGLGVAYISPADRTFKDIEDQLNCHVYLTSEYQDMIEQVDENVPYSAEIVEDRKPKAWIGVGERTPLAKPEKLPPTGARKRRASESGVANLDMSDPSIETPVSMGAGEPSTAASSIGPLVEKKSRTDTPWAPAEEQRLKSMRDAGHSWAEIAKVRCVGVGARIAQEPKTKILADFPS
jgi:hypothetical protein